LKLILTLDYFLPVRGETKRELETTVQYSKFDHTISIIQTLGKHVKIWKIDIKSTFRLLPCYPGDFNLLHIVLNSNMLFEHSISDISAKKKSS
jgi:hypothetical protein